MVLFFPTLDTSQTIILLSIQPNIKEKNLTPVDLSYSVTLAN